MRATIKGLRYNTRTATEIVAAQYHGSPADDEYWREILYRTPRAGHWFIWGEGGKASKFAYRADTYASWTGGERIFPLSEEEAFEWARDHMDDNELAQHFPDLVR